jgi:hypothetical protein
MLGRKDYTAEELDHAARAITRQLSAYKKLVRALDDADSGPEVAAASEAFESLFFNNMRWCSTATSCPGFARSPGKDGNPLNEVELIADSLINNAGKFRTNTVITYTPDKWRADQAEGGGVRPAVEGLLDRD